MDDPQKGPDQSSPQTNVTLGKNVLVYGTFELLHRGHLRLLDFAKSIAGFTGGKVVVGVTTGKMLAEDRYCKKHPVLSTIERMELLSALRSVDAVIEQTSREAMFDDVKNLDVGYILVGSDWYKNEHFEKIDGFNQVQVIYLPRTEGVSTSQIKEAIRTT